MSLQKILAQLPHLPPPVLTAYLDINPGNPRNQGKRGYIARLKSSGQALGKDLPKESRRAFRAQLKRIIDYVRLEQPRGRGLVVFAGRHVWEAVPLQVDVTEELHWGKPSLQQMMWVLDEHRPRGTVLLDGTGARFFEFWLGTVTEDEAATFSQDVSSWRKPYLVGPSTSGVFKQYGVQRDRVDARVAAQRGRFLRTLAERIVRWSDEKGISPVILVGSPDETKMIEEALPAEFRKRTGIIQKTLSHLSASDVEKRLLPSLKRWEREYEAAYVDDLISAQQSRLAVTGLDQTLTQLQEGRVRELVVARGLTGSLQQCVGCGWVDRSADPVCPSCGAKRRPRSLRTVLPELAGRQAVPVEVVAGEASKKLRSVGGIGAWVQTNRASSRSATGTENA